MTSAPRSASSMVQYGPASTRLKSATSSPASGPVGLLTVSSSGRVEVGQGERPVLVHREARVVGNLPEVAVRVGEVAGVTAVEGLAGRSGYRRAGVPGGVEYVVEQGRGG